MSKSDDSLDASPLGDVTAYRDRYAPELLFPVARCVQRRVLGLNAEAALPFFGIDLWNAYEISWLTPGGKPVAVLGTFRVPAASSHIIESKSLKLYLNSFNQTTFASLSEVRDVMVRDLSAAAGADVEVFLWEAAALAQRPLKNFAGILLDGLAVETGTYQPAPELLSLAAGDDLADETLVSHLFRSNCPVTGQPDWASVQIQYRGPRLRHESLLAYLISYRQHAGFHEHCVERIYLDIWQRCRPERLSVYARYTRRGGLDINPFRSSHPQSDPENGGDVRQ